jgi:hypothetical protein
MRPMFPPTDSKFTTQAVEAEVAAVPSADKLAGDGRQGLGPIAGHRELRPRQTSDDTLQRDTQIRLA